MPIYTKSFKAEQGEYYDKEHYNKIITYDEYGFNDKGELIFCFIKNAINPENRQKYKDAIRSCCKGISKNRGTASGPCDLRKFPKKANQLCNKQGEEFTDGKKRYSVYYLDENGNKSKMCEGNGVHSGVAGYFDKVAGMPCRKVGWSNDNPLKHETLIDLAKEIEYQHKKKCETSYNYHRKRANECPNELLFKDTIYSTMTLNYDFRTHSHIDKGDLNGGLSTLTIFEDEPDNYKGFYLGLPEYQICFDVRDGDTLIFNAHEYHANTEYEVLSDALPIDKLTEDNYAGRMSVVCYLREKMNLCDNLSISEIIRYKYYELYKVKSLQAIHKVLDKKYLTEEEKEHYRHIRTFGKDDRKGKLVKDFHELFDNNLRLRNEYIKLIKNISKEYDEPIYYQTTPNIRFHLLTKTSIGKRDGDPKGIVGYHKDSEFGHPEGEDNYIYALTDMYGSNSIYYGELENPQNVKLKKDQYKKYDFNTTNHWNKRNGTDISRVSLDFRIIPKSKLPEIHKADYYTLLN